MAIQNRLPLRCLLRISGRLKQLLVRLSLWPCILTFMNPHGRQNARVPVTVIVYHHVATPPTNAGWCRGILFGNTQHTHTHTVELMLDKSLWIHAVLGLIWNTLHLSKSLLRKHRKHPCFKPSLHSIRSHWLEERSNRCSVFLGLALPRDVCSWPCFPVSFF